MGSAPPLVEVFVVLGLLGFILQPNLRASDRLTTKLVRQVFDVSRVDWHGSQKNVGRKQRYRIEELNLKVLEFNVFAIQPNCLRCQDFLQ